LVDIEYDNDADGLDDGVVNATSVNGGFSDIMGGNGGASSVQRPINPVLVNASASSSATCGCTPSAAMTLVRDVLLYMSLDGLKNRLYSRGWKVEGGGFFVNFHMSKRKVRDMKISGWAAPGESLPLVPAIDIVAEEILDFDKAGPGWHREIQYYLPLIGTSRTKCIASDVRAFFSCITSSGFCVKISCVYRLL
jgi:hypothetical protein